MRHSDPSKPLLKFAGIHLAVRSEGRVPSHGFRWAPGLSWEDQIGPLEPLLRPIGADERTYQPSRDHPDLFRRFSELGNGSPDPDSTLSFANKFGALGIETKLSSQLRFYPVFDQQGSFGGLEEPLRAWRWEILVMRHLLRVWDALEDDSAPIWDKTLRKWFRLNGYGYGVFRPDREPVPFAAYCGDHTLPTSDLGSRDVPPGASEEEFVWLRGPLTLQSRGSQETEHRALAREFVRLIVSFRLSNHVSLHFAQVEEDSLITAMPKNLLGVLWLQVAFEVQHITGVRQCQQCKIWFDVPRTKRGIAQIAKYCSSACRMAAHRRKQTEAIA